jgi:hypothetical protein
MKALVWNNPYGSLMLNGKKETRTRETKVRGEVLICTAKKSYPKSTVWNISGAEQVLRMIRMYDITHDGVRWRSTVEETVSLNGYAIGVGTLVASYPMCREQENDCFVEYRRGLYVWEFENVRRIQPFPWKFGKQGWREVPESELWKIEYIDELKP